MAVTAAPDAEARIQSGIYTHIRVHSAGQSVQLTGLAPTTHQTPWVELSRVDLTYGVIVVLFCCFLFFSGLRECSLSFILMLQSSESIYYKGKLTTSLWGRPVCVEMISETPVTMPDAVSFSDRQPPSGHRQHAAAVSAASGETMMTSGSGSVVLPAGIINPSVPIRNIKMKFAVLIGLIQVGEVGNRDIVETVLNLVSKHLFPSSFLSLHVCTLMPNSKSEMLLSGGNNWP